MIYPKNCLGDVSHIVFFWPWWILTSKTLASESQTLCSGIHTTPPVATGLELTEMASLFGLVTS